VEAITERTDVGSIHAMEAITERTDVGSIHAMEATTERANAGAIHAVAPHSSLLASSSTRGQGFGLGPGGRPLPDLYGSTKLV